MLLPLYVDVPMRRWPIANFVIIAAITLFSFYGWSQTTSLSFGELDTLVLTGWDPAGMFGHVFLHADLFHLFGNMIFLWVFGNAVCAKVGNLAYPALFFGLGLVAAAAHLVLDGSPAIGASGAINGIVGAFLILYPLNSVTCFYFILLKWGTFAVSSAVIIGFWLLFDLYGAFSGQGYVAYWAHLGGFFGGAALLAVAVRLKIITMDRAERSLLDVIAQHDES